MYLMPCSLVNTRGDMMARGLINDTNTLNGKHDTAVTNVNAYSGKLKNQALTKYGTLPNANPFRLVDKQVLFNDEFFDWVDEQNVALEDAKDAVDSREQQLKTVLEKLKKRFNVQYEFVFDYGGRWAAKYKNNKVVINTAKDIGQEIPIHEYTHPLLNMLYNIKPEIYRGILNDAREQPEWKGIMEQVNKDIPNESLSTRRREVIARMIEMEAKGLVNNKSLADVLKRVWKLITDTLKEFLLLDAKITPDRLKGLTVKELAVFMSLGESSIDLNTPEAENLELEGDAEYLVAGAAAESVIRSMRRTGKRTKKKLSERKLPKLLKREKNLELQKEIVGRLDKTIAEMDPEKEGKRYKLKKGKVIRYRVTMDVVDKYRRMIYGDNNKITPEELDYRAKKGTVGHLYNQYILEAILEKKKPVYAEIKMRVKDELMKNPEFNNQWYTKEDGFYRLSGGEFNSLHRGLKARVDHVLKFDPDAVWRLEQVLYDENKDMAGTVDVLIVHTDGRVSMFDFKFKGMRYNPNRKKYLSIDGGDEILYESQLATYKNILYDSYGVEDFGLSRIVPINTQTKWNRTKNTVGKGELEFTVLHMGDDMTPQEEEHLKDVPVAEEMTDDPGINRMLQKLFGKRKELREILSEKRDDKAKIRLGAVDRSIKRLQLYQDVGGVITEISNVMNKVFEDGHTFGEESVNDYIEYVEMYRNFNVDFDTRIQGLKDEMKKEDYNRLLNTVSIFNHKLDQAKDMLTRRRIILAEEATELSLLDTGKQKGFMGRLFEGLANHSNPIFVRLGELISRVDNAVRIEVQAIEKELSEKDKAYRAWARKHDKKGISAFDFIINNKTGNLINRYKKEFYEEVDKQRELESYSWFKENFEFNQEQYKKAYINYVNYISDPIHGYNQAEIKDKIEYYESLSPEAMEVIVNGKKVRIKGNNKAWFNRSNYFIKAKARNEGDMVTEEWKFVYQKGNEAARDYLEYHMTLNQKYRGMVGYDKFRANFVANLQKDFIDNIGEMGVFKGFLKSGQAISQALQVREHDELRGVTDEHGNPVSRIPLLYITPLVDNISKSEQRLIEEEVAKKYKRGSVDFEKEVEKQVNKKRYEKGVKAKSRDLTRSLLLMTRSVYTNYYNHQIEASVRGLRGILANKEYLEETPTDKYGNPVLEKYTSFVAKKLGVSGDVVADFDKYVKAFIYGQKLQSTRMEVGGVSMDKLLLLAMQYLSIKVLGLNPVLAFASAFGAKVNSYFTGKEGLFYKTGHLQEAEAEVITRKPKASAAIGFFEPAARDLTYDKALKMSASKLVEWVNVRSIFTLHRLGDDNIDNTILVAMMKNYVIHPETGKILNPNSPTLVEEIPKDAKTVYDSFKRNEDTDTWYVEGLTGDEFTRFRRMHAMAANNIKGSMTQDQLALIDTTIWGRLLMQFRHWMPGLIRARFSGLRFEHVTEEYDVGRFRVAFGELFNSSSGFFKEFAMLGYEMFGMGFFGQKEINKEATKRYYNRWMAENKDSDLTLEGFMKLRERKFHAFAMEARAWLMLLGTLYMLQEIFKTEDDEEPQLITSNIYRMVERAQLEMSFFFELKSVTQILKSPLPLLRLFTDISRGLQNLYDETIDITLGEDSSAHIWNTGTRDTKPFGYYTIKAIPGAAQLPTLLTAVPL
jgi:hypothetical protein